MIIFILWATFTTFSILGMFMREKLLLDIGTIGNLSIIVGFILKLLLI